MIERYKDVEIDGRKFRLGRVTAQVGNWICIQVMNGRLADQPTYDKILNYMLAQCNVYKGEAPMKLVNEEGRRVYPDPDMDLEFDLELVHQLYIENFKFNFGSFFRKRAQEEEARQNLASAIQDTMSPPSRQTSLDISGVR